VLEKSPNPRRRTSSEGNRIGSSYLAFLHGATTLSR
jgi:hypothetical protein